MAGLALAEGLLRLASLAAPHLFDRGAGPAAGETFRILCLGDSYTYGLGVERSESWPAQLERDLEALGGPRRFEVINLGIPAANSAQVLAGLPEHLARYRPDLLIVLIGGNDGVNSAGSDVGAGESSRLRQALWHLRLVRLMAYALGQRRLTHAPVPEGPVEVTWENPFGTIELRHGPYVERFSHRMHFDAMLPPEEQERIARTHLAAIARQAQEASVPLVLPSYPHDRGTFQVANRAMRKTDGALFVSMLYPRDLGAQVPPPAPGQPRRKLFQPDLHPNAPIYAAYAAHLRDALLRAGLVPAAR